VKKIPLHKILGFVFITVFLVLLIFLLLNNSEDQRISSFEECVESGYPIMESYPRKCAVPGGDTFTEELN
jgi:hypothetical protein